MKFINKFIRLFCRFLVKFIRSSPFALSIKIRVWSYSYLLKRIGKDITICDNIYIDGHYNLSLGDRVSIHQFSYINAEGGVQIGDYVSIGSHVIILSSTHNYLKKNLNFKQQGIILKSTKIGNNVWIGSRTTIMEGIKIGNNVIIGAHSLVTKDIPDNVMAFGSPCKVYKKL